MRLRRTAKEWKTDDPVVPSGQLGQETDTLKVKRGNGLIKWSLLNYEDKIKVNSNGHIIVTPVSIARAIAAGRELVGSNAALMFGAEPITGPIPGSGLSQIVTAAIVGNGVVAGVGAFTGSGTRTTTVNRTGTGAVIVHLVGSGSRTTTAIFASNGSLSGPTNATGTVVVTATLTGNGVVKSTSTGSLSSAVTTTGAGLVAGTRTSSPLTVTATITATGVAAFAKTGTPVTAAATITGFGTTLNFVTLDSATGNLMLNGQRFMFSGANTNLGPLNYTPLYGATADAEGYHLASHSQIDDYLTQVSNMNATVIRSYGAVCSVGRLSAVQPSLGTFSSANLEDVDYLLQQCAIKNIRVYFPLVDAYDFEPRGAPWYCTVNGVTPDGNASQFYNLANTAIVNSFKAHISFVLNHVNVYTGLKYKDDPVILAWETGNELHSGGWTATNVAWVDDITRYIKLTLGARQLIMDGTAYNPTGDDGGRLEIDLPYVDIMTHHAYGNGALPNVTNSGATAHAHGKAFVVGEYAWNGLTSGGAGLDWTLDQFITQVEASGFVDGTTHWQQIPLLVGVGGPAIFGLHFPGDNSDMITRGTKMAAHASAMTALGTTAPPSPVTFLTDNFTGTDGTALGSHTPDSGGGAWSFASGGGTNVETIQSNRLYTTAAFTNYAHYGSTPQNANYDVTLTLQIVSHAAGSDVWVLGRVVNGAFTSYQLNVHCTNSTTYTMSLLRQVNGSTVTLLSGAPITVAPTVGSSHTLTLRMRGNQISGLWDGKVNLRINNADINAKGFAGLGATAVTSTTGMHIDSIVATSPPPAEATVSSVFAPTSNETVAVGDSVTDNYSVADYQPYQGSSYLPLLTVQTLQRIKYKGIYARGGTTATYMRDIQIPQVVALSPLPRACILYPVTNDTGNIDRTWNLTYTAEVWRDMIRSLMNAGIAPILTTIGPHDEFPSYTPNSKEWNAYVRAFAAAHGFPLIDVWAAITTGDSYTSGFSPDGLHPNSKGYEAIVNRAINVDGIPNIFPAAPAGLTVRTTGDLTNILNDGTINLGMFTADTNADGVSNGFTTSGQVMFRDIPSGWSVGNRLALSARVRTANITTTGVSWSLSVRLTVPGGFTYPDGSSTTSIENGLELWTFDANGLMYTEFTVPTGTTAMQLRATLASGTPVFSRVTPAGGDNLVGSWQRLRDNSNSTQLDIGELTLRDATLVLGNTITAAITGAGVVAKVATGSLTTTATISGATSFLNDSFTDTNGTVLESHTAGGVTWTKHTGWTGTFTVQTNRIVGGASSEAHYYASPTPPSANYDVTATIVAMSNASFSSAAPAGRMVVGANQGYAAFAIFNGSVTTIYINVYNNNTGVSLASANVTTPTVGSSHTLTLRMVGSSLSALWDGTVVVGPTTDTTFSAAGRAGVITNGIGSSSTGWHIDSITAL